MRLLACLQICISCFLLIVASAAQAKTMDSRMQVLLQPSATQPTESLRLAEATALALPTLWQRVVPSSHLEQANVLKGNARLVLRFQPLKHGAKVTFNPTQVRAFLAKHGIPMITEQPRWNFSVNAVGFPDIDAQVSADLLDYSQDIASELGMQLSPRGQRLHLVFSPTQDTYGENILHLNLQGSFSAELLSQTDMLQEGYISDQLQAWLKQVMREIRDAYSLGKIEFTEESSQTLLTIEAVHTLSTQVMLEQALSQQPNVLALTPTLLQQARRQYRIKLRDGDDSWMIAWFAEYGLTATQQAEDGFTDWLVQ